MAIYKLKGVTKDYIWGGNRLFKYGKTASTDIIAESWELSYFPGAESIIDSGVNKGKKINDVLSNSDIGTNAKKHPMFPVLIKLIDAMNDLSIQVHPSDEYALKNENSLGKTEMWYVVDAAPNAMLHIGFNRDVTKEEMAERIANNTITDVMNHIVIKPGDCYFIPSGTLHAIGKGSLILEIQENSNLTYRVYDYGRVGKDGKPRELHVEKALKVTNLSKSVPSNLQNDVLADCEYFKVSKIKNAKEIITDESSFACFTILKGSGKIDDLEYHVGDTFIVTANSKVGLTGDNLIVLTRIN